LPKRLAENPCQFSENFNYNNHIGGPESQAFPLPSKITARFPASTDFNAEVVAKPSPLMVESRRRRHSHCRLSHVRFELADDTTTDAEAGAPKRFDVELFIVHPTLDPAEISAALGLDAKFSHCVGEQRKTPKGTPLEGTHRDTRWRHTRRHETPDQWFADKVAELLDRIEPHREFLKKLRATGGRACVIVQFLGDGYFGDEIPQETLKKLADLELDLGIECFTDQQQRSGLKNIQIIDGALNCTFSIFQATDKEFALLFPDPQQDIQYAEALTSLPRQEEVGAALRRIWERPVRKQDALGIHGTLFYQLERYKTYYRANREDAIDPSAVNEAQRRLFGIG